MDYFVLRFDHSYRKEDILALSRLSSRIMRKWRSRIMRIFCTVLGDGDFRERRSCSDAAGDDAEWHRMDLIGRDPAPRLCFLQPNQRMGHKETDASVENLTIKFSDEGLAQSSSKAAASVPYHAFERLYHYRDRYFLFVDKLHAYILPEDRFVVGDSADFRAFIEAKTGKTVEYI